jgi:hypothetical protein
MPSDRVREILPPDTAATWDAIASVVPHGAYLGGGTAIAVHLGHQLAGTWTSSSTRRVSTSTSWPAASMP